MHICTNELCGCLNVSAKNGSRAGSAHVHDFFVIQNYQRCVDNEARAVDGSSQTFGPFSAWPSCHLMVFTSARDPDLELLLKTV